MEAIHQWISANQSLLTWVFSLSLLIFVVSLLALPWLVSRIPEDYFLHSHRQPGRLKESHPLVRTLLLAGKNLLGAVLLCGGILMLVLPGQGLLTIIMGLLLLDYPGKFKLEQKIVAIPVILNGLNWLREKAKHPPLKID